MRKHISTIQDLDALRERRVRRKRRPRRRRTTNGSSFVPERAASLRAPGGESALEEECKNRGIQDRVEIVETGCLGPCSAGPVLRIDEVFYDDFGRRTPATLLSNTWSRADTVSRLTHKRLDGRDVPLAKDIDFFKRQAKIVFATAEGSIPSGSKSISPKTATRPLARVLSQNEPGIGDPNAEDLRACGAAEARVPTALKWRFTWQAAGK